MAGRRGLLLGALLLASQAPLPAALSGSDADPEVEDPQGDSSVVLPTGGADTGSMEAMLDIVRAHIVENGTTLTFVVAARYLAAATSADRCTVCAWGFAWDWANRTYVVFYAQVPAETPVLGRVGYDSLFAFGTRGELGHPESPYVEIQRLVGTVAAGAPGLIEIELPIELVPDLGPRDQLTGLFAEGIYEAVTVPGPYWRRADRGPDCPAEPFDDEPCTNFGRNFTLAGGDEDAGPANETSAESNFVTGGANATNASLATDTSSGSGDGTIDGTEDQRGRSGLGLSATFPWAFVGAGLALVALASVVLAVRVRRTRRAVPVRRGPPGPVHPPRPGHLFLSKYRVERELGRGAFGTVWLATHAQLGRKVVIKQLHPEWSAIGEARTRFQREARILAQLDHPNVTRIYDVELVGATWYIVMEYVEGGSLEDRLANGPLKTGEALRITSQVLSGLAFIHRKGVLHRDIKPSNILVTPAFDAKIADFGVARGRGFETTKLTSSGSPPGTPLYMSPEQVQGKSGDARSDLFSLAAVFYALVTGRSYLGEVPPGLLDLLKAIAEGSPALPVRGLSPALNAWLARGLAKRPDERFQTAEEMRAALAVATRS